eukprot:360414_1
MAASILLTIVIGITTTIAQPAAITFPGGRTLNPTPINPGANYNDPNGMGAPIFDKKTTGNAQVSTNFKVNEFTSKDGAKFFRLSPILIQCLQIVRNVVNKPLVINSGYRTVAHNTAVGGAANSYHLSGTAADVAKPVGITMDEFAARIVCICRPLFQAQGNDIGLGLGANYIHVDMRKKFGSWVYDGASKTVEAWKRFIESGSYTCAPTSNPTGIPTIAPSKVPTNAPSEVPTPTPIISSCMDDYVWVNEEMDYEDADEYCLGHYGTHLVTIPGADAFENVLLIMEGDSGWIGLHNTHKAGWFLWLDGTECANVYGLCTDGSWWKDGYPKKTCKAHHGSWFVALYADGYIDNFESGDVKKAFICNCLS